jgi:DNA-binding NarL/FixJ family response regulator
MRRLGAWSTSTVLPILEVMMQSERNPPAMPAGERVLIAVVAGAEADRAALSSAFAGHPKHRVVCSASLQRAPTALEHQPVDALVGFIDDPGEWSAFRALAERFPDVLTILLVSEPDRIDAISDGSLLDAVVRASRDELPARAAEVVAGAGAPSTPVAAANAADRRKLDALSEREREILALTAGGMSIKEIARRLHRGYGTVAAHRVNIMEKLDLHDKVALTRFAIRTGLIEA